MTTNGASFAFSQSRAQDTTYRQNIFGIYAQDTWHITPTLTVNYGVRWEPNLYQTDKFGRGATFDQAAFNANRHSAIFPNAPAGALYYGDPGVPKSFTNNQWANISPRVAFTLDPFATGKTVLRAGGAMMYDSPSLYMSQRVASNPPFVNEIDVNGQTSFDDPWRGYPGGIPFPGVFPPNASATFPTNTLWVLLQKTMQTPSSTSGTPAFSRTSATVGCSPSTTLATSRRTSGSATVSTPRPTSPATRRPRPCQGMPQVVFPTAAIPTRFIPSLATPAPPPVTPMRVRPSP